MSSSNLPRTSAEHEILASSINTVDSSDWESSDTKRNMESLEREMTVLKWRMNQMFKLVGHCKVEVPSDPQKAKELMETAMELGGMDQLANQCSQSIEKSLNDKCAIDIYKFASRKKVQRLIDASRMYILKNFMSVYSSDDLLTLDMSDLSWFLGHNELCVTSEKNVVDTVFGWVRKDPGNRKAQVGELIASVRLYCCEQSFLTYLKDHHLLHDKESFQRELQIVLQDLDAGSPIVGAKIDSSKRRTKLNSSSDKQVICD